MGSSVFHGGFSTFLAISVLAISKSYIFVVFFRMWFGIIIFGMSNGFFLLPVVLSFIGPVQEEKKMAIDKKIENEKENSKTDIVVEVQKLPEAKEQAKEEPITI